MRLNSFSRLLQSECTVFSLLFLGVLLLFSLTNLDGSWVLDDHYMVKANPFIESVRYIPRILTTPVWFSSSIEQASSDIYRPIFVLSLLFDYQIFGLSSAGFHFTNNLIHALNVVLFFLCARFFLGVKSSIWAAALFGFHPIVTEPVTWISSRTDLLAAFFAFLTLYASISFFSGRGQRRLWWAVVFAFCIPFGVFSKEIYAVVPFLSLGYVWLEKGRNENGRQAFLAFILFAALAFVLSFLWRGHVITGSISGLFSPMVLSNFDVLCRRFLEILLMPFDLDFINPYATAVLGTPWSYVLGVFWSTFFLGVTFFYRKNHTILFGLAWFLGTLLPVVLILDLVGLVGERYFYLPFAGFSLAFVALVQGSLPRLKNFMSEKPLAWIRLGALVFMGLLVFLTAVRNRDWRSEAALYQSSILRDDSNHLPHFYLAMHYAREGEKKLELYSYAEALKRDPTHLSSLNNMGVKLMAIGELGQAKEYLDRSYKLSPRRAKTHFNYGVYFENVGDLDRAAKAYKNALGLNPQYLSAQKNLQRIETRRSTVE